LLSGLAAAADGVISVQSASSVAVTADKLARALDAKGMTVFARIDHAAGAARVDKSLRPTQLLIFGNPMVGTPLMQCSQSVALDLPQKALIWEDAEGAVWLSYNDPGYLDARHGLAECAAVLKKVSAALANFAAAATSSSD
jgi:uncharacterized protein (DUF302 family)